MKRTINKFLSVIMVLSFILTGLVLPVQAASSGSVVINEIAWMGNLDSGSAEWIELFNTTSSDIDLSGWKLIDDGTSEHLIESGTIQAGGYFLIEADETATGLLSDTILPLSLANSGDSLELKDAFGNSIDRVNSSGGAWFAGSNTSKVTMERINPTGSGDDATNWADSTMILGSPKDLNQQVPPPVPDIEILSPAQLQSGSTVTFTVGITDATEAFSYGMDIQYDPSVMRFVGAEEGDFLRSMGQNTSFNAAMEGDLQGLLVIGNAIIEDFAAVNGVSGSGTLYTMNFDVIGPTGTDTAINFVPDSFLSNKNNEVIATFIGLDFTVGDSSGGSGSGSGPVGDLSASLGAAQYSFDLNWTVPTEGADTYKVMRKDAKGEFVEIGNVSGTGFTDSDDLADGGHLIPHVAYEYKVIPILNGQNGQEALVSITENRGIKGDNNRSNRVDGRDLDSLAKHFGSELGVDSEYETLIDTTYDGFLDGSDLIDLAANWALVYN